MPTNLPTLVLYRIYRFIWSWNYLILYKSKQECYPECFICKWYKPCQINVVCVISRAAYCRNSVDGRWYSYDDSSVDPVPEGEVCTRAAYILFYQRRDAIPTWSASCSLRGEHSCLIEKHWCVELNLPEEFPTRLYTHIYTQKTLFKIRSHELFNEQFSSCVFVHCFVILGKFLSITFRIFLRGQFIIHNASWMTIDLFHYIHFTIHGSKKKHPLHSRDAEDVLYMVFYAHSYYLP